MKRRKFLTTVALLLVVCCSGQTDFNSTRIIADKEMCSSPSYQLLQVSPDLSNSGVTYRWFVDESLQSNEPNYRFESAIEAQYEIRLEASNGSTTVNDIVTIQVNQTNLPVFIDDDSMFCTAKQVGVEEAFNGDGWIPIWYNANGDFISSERTVLIEESGVYSVMLTSLNGCESNEISRGISIINGQMDSVVFDTTSVVRGEEISLEHSSLSLKTEDFSFKWISNEEGRVVFDNPSTLFTPEFSSDFILVATSVYNEECEYYGNPIHIELIELLDLPNAFSPNNDGVNDVWTVTDIDKYPIRQVKIYNRWGQLIYTSNGSFTEWDGRIGSIDAPAGTYYYILDYDTGLNYRGNITIVR